MINKGHLVTGGVIISVIAFLSTATVLLVNHNRSLDPDPLLNTFGKKANIGIQIPKDKNTKKSLKVGGKEKIDLYKKIISNTMSEADVYDLTHTFNQEIKNKDKSLKLKLAVDNKMLGATVENGEILIGSNLTQEQILETLEIILLALED